MKRRIVLFLILAALLVATACSQQAETPQQAGPGPVPQAVTAIPTIEAVMPQATNEATATEQLPSTPVPAQTATPEIINPEQHLPGREHGNGYPEVTFFGGPERWTINFSNGEEIHLIVIESDELLRSVAVPGEVNLDLSVGDYSDGAPVGENDPEPLNWVTVMTENTVDGPIVAICAGIGEGVPARFIYEGDAFVGTYLCIALINGEFVDPPGTKA